METPPRFHGFPRKEHCDPTNPYEAFLWMLVGLPGQNGGPLILPIEYLQLISKRLWDLGARPVEEPVLEWVAPTGSEPNWMTSPGKWVPKGTAPVVDERTLATEAVGQMASQQRAELFEVLTLWSEGAPIPKTPAGAVAESLADSQKQLVLEVLQQW